MKILRFLIGNNEIVDKIKEAKQKSWIVSQNEQISFIQNNDKLNLQSRQLVDNYLLLYEY